MAMSPSGELFRACRWDQRDIKQTNNTTKHLISNFSRFDEFIPQFPKLVA